MGVPGIFSWLLKKLRSKEFNKIPVITTECPEKNIDTLYIDANCLFHPQCFKILNHYTQVNDVEKLENKMIKRIIEYISYLISFTKPKDVYIAVDGVCPLAKMKQQRMRRYKSVQDNEIINNIKKQHGHNTVTIWSNTSISPSTIFMEKLHIQLLTYCKNLSIPCVYSSFHKPGEGEHKILKDIKQNKNKTDIIYGLDADLIFLSLACGNNNIYLLRECTELNKKHVKNNDPMAIEEELNFVSIDNIKLCINTIINAQINEMNKNSVGFVDENGAIPQQFDDHTNDYILICYFLGNDFIPNIPSIDIKNDGMDLLIKIYVTTYLSLNEHFYVNKRINEKFLHSFIYGMAKYEKYYFETKYVQYKQRLDNQTCTSDNLYEIDIWNFDNVKNVEIHDPIKLGQGDYTLWKNRYYETYYSVSSQQDTSILVNNMCKNFIEGIFWVTKYYFDSDATNNWQYNYFHCPFASDIANYLKSNKNLKIKFKPNIVINPLTQLLSVISPSCKNLLPIPYQKLMSSESEISYMFPQHVQVDMLYKHVQHKCIPFIPNINIESIIEATKNVKISEAEQKRNMLLDDFVYNK